MPYMNSFMSNNYLHDMMLLLLAPIAIPSFQVTKNFALRLVVWIYSVFCPYFVPLKQIELEFEGTVPTALSQRTDKMARESREPGT